MNPYPPHPQNGDGKPFAKNLKNHPGYSILVIFSICIAISVFFNVLWRDHITTEHNANRASLERKYNDEIIQLKKNYDDKIEELKKDCESKGKVVQVGGGGGGEEHPNPKNPSSFVKSFKGIINDNINIEMKLEKKGSILSGTYKYKVFGRPVTIKGKIDNKNIHIDGYDGLKKIDIFKGRFVSDSLIQGTWHKADGKASAPFTFRESN